MRVVLAENAGTCYGVKRALDIAQSVAHENEQTHAHAPKIFAQTLGPLIHNPRVVQDLESSGIGVAKTPADICTNTVILRSHGVLPSVRERLEQMCVHIEDATCPYVLRAQRAAFYLAQKHGCVLVVGAAGHPEVEGLIAYARLGCQSFEIATGGVLDSALDGVPDEAVDGVGAEATAEPTSELHPKGEPAAQNPCVIVASCAAELPHHLPKELGVVVQTTQSTQNLDEILDVLHARGVQTDVKNTICSATTIRQESAAHLAAQADAVVVIGGKNSSNTTRLFQICKQTCVKTYHIEDASELTPAMFAGCNTIGVSAGASTPEAQIQEVINRLKVF